MNKTRPIKLPADFEQLAPTMLNPKDNYLATLSYRIGLLVVLTSLFPTDNSSSSTST